MSRKSLRHEIASLERQLDGRSSRRASRRGRGRRAGRYMDEMDDVSDVESFMDEMLGDDEVMAGEDWMVDPDEEVDWAGEDWADEEDMMNVMMDEDLDDEVDFIASRRRASRRRRRSSEVAPGIEDEITQDYLSEVVEVAPGSDGDPDAELVVDVAPTQMARLKEASARLDRLANYVEKEARRTRSAKWLKVAARIDGFADQIDSKIRSARRTR